MIAYTTALAALNGLEDERLAAVRRGDDLAAEFARHMAEPHYPAPEPTAPATPPLGDLVGLRVLPQQADSTYGQHDALTGHLADLGIRRVTGLFDANMSPRVIAFYQRLHRDLGIKLWFTVGKPRVLYGRAEWERIRALVDGPLAGMIEQVANWNEPNDVRDPRKDPPLGDWVGASATQQRGLWDVFHPRGIDVATVQLHSGNPIRHERDLRAVAPRLAGCYDRVAWHWYPRGGDGVADVAALRALCRDVFGDYPVSCTEAGWFDAPAYTGGGAVPVTSDAAAGLLVPHTRAYTDHGDRVGYFEALDAPDPTGTEREDWLGWIRTPALDPATWVRKPIYHAARAMLAIAA